VSFSSLDDVTMTPAPLMRANCSANIDTPPVPSTSTVWPARTVPLTFSAFHAVTPAHGRVAASS